jgi:hypothetical protein
MTNMMPLDVLETNAAAQRKQIHNDVAAIKDGLRHTLQPRKLARQYLAPAAGVAALIGVVLGWGVTSVFTRD